MSHRGFKADDEPWAAGLGQAGNGGTVDGIFVVREKLVLKGRISATGEWDGNLQWERIAEHPLHPLPSTADEAQMTKKKKKKKETPCKHSPQTHFFPGISLLSRWR